MADSVDWDRLWALATTKFALGQHSLHGPHHWRQVERNALQLAAESEADETVVRLFALVHDSCRLNESHDPEHGLRAAEWAKSLRGELILLDPIRFELLTDACIAHDRGFTSGDPTIGTCWDADRLDLGRVGMRPNPAYMSTAPGRALAAKGWPFIR